jgi:CubicO group peptidase (beta-lactamase class C family)
VSELFRGRNVNLGSLREAAIVVVRGFAVFALALAAAARSIDGKPRGTKPMTTQVMLDRRTLMATLAALAVPVAGRAATAADYHNLQAFLDGYIASRKLPGAVIAIKHANDPVQYMSAGTIAYDTTKKADPDSIYRIYSMTKPITGIAAMKLVEDGKIKLDQPISDILPDFKNMKVTVNQQTGETRPAVKPILIRHLLTHTAGLGYSINAGPLGKLYTKNGIVPGLRATEKEEGADLAPVRDLETFGKRLATMPLDFEPGSRWQYAVGIDLMGLIIQRVSGMSFWDYLHRNIFIPLKMNDTDFVVPKAKADRLTSVYATQGSRIIVTEDRKTSPYLRDRDIQSGGGGLASTARDYARFTSMLLNEGSLDGARIIKPETFAKYHSNLMDPGVAFARNNAFGAAVALVLPGGETPGQMPAGSFWWFGIAGSQMWVDPKNKLSVILMIQQNPTTLPVQSELRVAAYKDLPTLKA